MNVGAMISGRLPHTALSARKTHLIHKLLVRLRRLGCHHFASHEVVLTLDTLSVKGKTTRSRALRSTEAPVSGVLASNSEVSIQRSHRIRHPPSLAVLHGGLNAAIGHGRGTAVHTSASHQVAGHSHGVVGLKIVRHFEIVIPSY